MEYISKSVTETFEIASKIAADLKAGDILALFGDLGSGKTTFTQGLARALGVDKPITSPTFVIMKRYPLSPNSAFNELIHLDCYRFVSEEDAVGVGLDEIIDQGNSIVVVEWPERIWPMIKDRAKTIKFEYLNEYEREISY